MLLLALGAAVVVCTVCTVMALRVPNWFVRRTVAAEEAALGEAIERRVLSKLSAAHPFGTPWTITVSDLECESWLNTRLSVWLENQNTPRPAWLGFVGVSFTERRACVAIATRSDARPPVVSFAIFGGITPDAIPRPEASLGTLPLPRWVVETFVPGLGRHLDQALSAASVGSSTAPDGAPLGVATIRLDDGRRVRVRRVETGPGTITLHCTTIGRAAERR